MAKKEETPETEPVVLKEDMSHVKSDSNVPEVREYIAEMRNNNLTFVEISDGLKTRGFNVDPNTISKMYKEIIAKSIVTHNTAKEEYDDFSEALRETYKEAIGLLGEYVRNLRAINKKFSEVQTDDGDVDTLQAKLMVAKTIPLAVGLLKEIREYNKFQADLADTITHMKEGKLEITNNMEEQRKWFPLLCKEAEKIGAIKILDLKKLG